MRNGVEKVLQDLDNIITSILPALCEMTGDFDSAFEILLESIHPTERTYEE